MNILEISARHLTKFPCVENFRYCAVAPGFIDTDMTKNMTEDAKKALNSMIPMGKMGSTKNIADLVLFLAGEQSDYITGQVICVDGGMCI